WPNNRRPSASKLDNNRALSTDNLANKRSRSTSKLDNKRSRSTSKSDNKRTNCAAQQYARKTPSHLRATFNAMPLLRHAEGAYAYCCNRGAGSVHKGTPIAERVFYVCRIRISALPPKADITNRCRDVCFVPKADIAP